MTFLFDSMAQTLALTAFIRNLDDEEACRDYLRRQGWGVEKLDASIMRDIIERAKFYRRRR